MQARHDFKIQRLFALALILKVIFATLGWFANSPWLLGFGLPLAVMAAYIYAGMTRRDKEVSDEKFADSCYYLGFIFTITSIIFSLFDLPQIGTKIQDIAVRFGASMVSTVFGLGVRVYLVGFQKEAADALKDAEGAVVEAANRFQEQLRMSMERFQAFQTAVDDATAHTVERVNLQMEKATEAHVLRFSEVFDNMAARNRQAFEDALNELKAAGAQFSSLVENYSTGVQKNLDVLESRVSTFTDEAARHLQKTAFPDDFFQDYFIQHMSEPLELLKTTTGETTRFVAGTAADIAQASTTLNKALKAISSKVSMAEVSLDALQRISEQQEAVLAGAKGQLDTLGALNETLGKLTEVMKDSVSEVKVLGSGTTVLGQQVNALSEESAASRAEVTSSLRQVAIALRAHSDNSDHQKALAESTKAAIESLVRATTGLGEEKATAVQDVRQLTAELASVVKSLRPTMAAPLQGFNVESESPGATTSVALSPLATAPLTPSATAPN